MHHIMQDFTLRDGVDLISRGRRKPERGNAGVPTICMGYEHCYFAAVVCFVYLA